MRRGPWIALIILFVLGIAGALALGRALERRNRAATTSTQSLVPAGARLVSRATLPATARIPAQTAVVWSRPLAGDPAVKRFGVELWQGTTRVYSHRSPVNTDSVAVEAADFTGDGHDDVLVYDNTDGSGGCGVYRALATAQGSVSQVVVRLLCEDEGSIHLLREGLVFRIARSKDPKTRLDIHCCYRSLRTTVARWNGHALVRVRTTVRRLHGRHWPPGGYPPGGPA